MGGVTEPGAGPERLPARVHVGADVSDAAEVGAGTVVWPLAHVREGARVGSDCILGRGSYVGPGVRVGDRCKIKDQALVYEPALLEDGVFIGPAAVLTNDTFPRAVTPTGVLKTADDWDMVGVTLREGASIGARAVCVAPVTVGRWALVGAGAVVVDDVPDHALVVGSPARRVRWVGRAGVPLEERGEGLFVCPRTGEEYREAQGRLSLLRGDAAGPAANEGVAHVG